MVFSTPASIFALIKDLVVHQLHYCLDHAIDYVLSQVGILFSYSSFCSSSFSSFYLGVMISLLSHLSMTTPLFSNLFCRFLIEDRPNHRICWLTFYLPYLMEI